MIPGNRLASQSFPLDLLPPDDRERDDLLKDYELAGVAANDPSQGLRVRVWEAFFEADSVKIKPEGGSPTTTLFSAPGTTELTLAFDQNMRPAVAYVQDGECKLYWYDALVSAQVTTNFGPTLSSPFLTLDDKREVASITGRSDVLFFYVKAGNLYYRQQRDRYGVERLLQASVPPRITKAGMSRSYRIEIEMP